jgi:hypothetical protein
MVAASSIKLLLIVNTFMNRPKNSNIKVAPDSSTDTTLTYCAEKKSLALSYSKMRSDCLDKVEKEKKARIRGVGVFHPTTLLLIVV